MSAIFHYSSAASSTTEDVTGRCNLIQCYRLFVYRNFQIGAIMKINPRPRYSPLECALIMFIEK
jgi:hypothetical protein